MNWKFARRIGTLTSAAVLSATIGLGTVGAESKTATNIDAVIAVDVSGSMKTSDVNNVSYEAMKMFVDMAAVQGDKIGIVAYTDQIIREKALLKIDSADDKQDLKTFIDQLTRASFTDIGLGVEEAVKVLDSGKEEGHVPMVVVLTDGNTDLKDGASYDDAEKRLNQAVQAAKDKGIPVYVIGLNADGKLNKDALTPIADKTGGKLFITSTADKLPQILSEIYADHLKLKVLPLKSYVADGSYQDIGVAVPNASVQEANISILSTKPVELQLTDPSGAAVKIPSDNVLLTRSKAYTLVKLVKPVQGNWTLKVKGAAKDQISVSLIYNYDMQLVLTPPTTDSFKPGDTIPISAHFESEGGKLDDAGLYQAINATLVVTDKVTGNREESTLTVEGQEIKGSYVVPDKGDYSIQVVARADNFERDTEAFEVKVDAKASTDKAAPAADPEPEKPVDTAKDSKSFPWLMVIGGVVGLAVVAALVAYVLRRMKHNNRGFFGQIVIEIRDVNTGERSTPQFKRLTAYKGKFSLHHLLNLAPEFAEAAQITFKHGKGDSLLLLNQSSSSIEKGGRALDASKGLELMNNDKLKVVLTSSNKAISLEYIK